jgi:hypothetical protein
VFHLDVAYVLEWLHTCFRCMLQVFQLFRTYVVMFSLNVAKIDLVLHILWWTPSAVAGPTSVRVGVEGVRAAGVGNRAGANRDGAGIGHEAARDTKQAWDTE